MVSFFQNPWADPELNTEVTNRRGQQDAHAGKWFIYNIKTHRDKNVIRQGSSDQQNYFRKIQKEQETRHEQNQNKLQPLGRV